jgi:hypothetical protein
MNTLTKLSLLTLGIDDIRYLTRIALMQGKEALFAQQAPELLENLRQAPLIGPTETSNVIEGVIVSSERVKALVLHDAKPKDCNEREVAGYRDVLKMIHESHAHMPISVGMVQQLHQCGRNPQCDGRFD